MKNLWTILLTIQNILSNNIDKKQEQNPNKSLDDTLDDTTTILSNKNYENYEQKSGFRRFDGVDDTLHIMKVKEHFVKEKNSLML